MLKIGIIGDFDKDFLPHEATEESLQHAGIGLKINAKSEWISTESLKESGEYINEFDGIWVAPGKLYKSVTGAINGIQVARENNIPILGTCRGFQHMLIEFGRNVLGILGEELEKNNPFLSQIVSSRTDRFLNNNWIDIKLQNKSLAHSLYNIYIVREQDVCSFEINTKYRSPMEQNNLLITATDMSQIPRIAEYITNNYYLGTLFVPQLNSSYELPHPIITGFLYAAFTYSNQKQL